MAIYNYKYLSESYIINEPDILYNKKNGKMIK